MLVLDWNALQLLQCGCTTWTLTKRLEKKLDGNYTRMLRAILNRSWRQDTNCTATCVLSRKLFKLDEPDMQDTVLLWTPTHGRAKAGRPARTYIQQLCEDTGCCPEDLPEAMNDREKWRERVRDIRATSTTWWWWWWDWNTWNIITVNKYLILLLKYLITYNRVKNLLRNNYPNMGIQMYNEHNYLNSKHKITRYKLTCR